MKLRKFNPSHWFRHEDESRAPAVRRDDISPRQAFHTEVDRMFDDFFSSLWNRVPAFPGLGESMLRPRLDLRSTDKEYVLSVELPGVDEKDVSIEVSGETLTVSGEKKQESEEKDEEKGFYRSERRYGSFRRTLALPDDVRPDDIAARFDKGVLTVTMPREEPKGKKSIPITTGGPEKQG